MELVWRLKRKEYRGMTTTGELTTPFGKQFSFTLEDIVRAPGIKDKGNTAIPAGIYRMVVNKSSRFNRDMVLLYNQSDLSVMANEVKFTGVRVHGGNTHFNTEGCILVAKNRISDQKIQGTMEAEFTDMVKKQIADGHEVFIEITNEKQLS